MAGEAMHMKHGLHEVDTACRSQPTPQIAYVRAVFR